MKVDLFLEFASPPSAGRTPAAVVEDGLALARAADAAGLDAVWLAEHHFLGDYSNASAPDMLLAAMARETRHIRLGFGILPLPLHHPVRVAERLATLDLLSNGRVLWGVGRGVTVTELEGFGVDPAESRAVSRRNLDALREILQTGEWRCGDSVYPLRPKPAVRLHEGWLAAVSPESFDLAAEMGLDLLTGPFKPWPMVKTDIRRYRRLRPEGRTSFTLAVYCDEDHQRARRRAADGLVWVYRKIFEVAGPLLRGQVAGYEQYRRLGWLVPLFDRTLSLTLLETLGLAAVGSPAHVEKRLRRLQEFGLDRISLVIGGGDLSREETESCVNLLGREVLPQLRAAPRNATMKEVAPA